MKKFLLTTVSLLIIAINASADPIITAFTSTTGVTSDGKLLISSTDYTNLSFKLTVSRPLVPGTITYEEVDMDFYLVFRSSNGVEEVLSGPFRISTPNFNNGSSAIRFVDGPIGPNRLGSIFIRYYFTTPTYGLYVGPLESTQRFETSVGANPIPAPYLEGNFQRDVLTGKVYWHFEGRWRHIQSALTLQGLFNYNWVRNNTGSSTGQPPGSLGDVLGPNNALIRYSPTGQVFFLEENLIRYITGPAVFDRYHFNWNIIKNVNSISQYQVGPPIQ